MWYYLGGSIDRTTATAREVIGAANDLYREAFFLRNQVIRNKK
jgi:hypothetical protein